MKIDINKWGILLNDEQVSESIEICKDSLWKLAGWINKNKIDEVYNTIVNNDSINNRAKLYYLDSFENKLIKSEIRTTEDVVKFKNSLFK